MTSDTAVAPPGGAAGRPRPCASIMLVVLLDMLAVGIIVPVLR